MSDATRWCPVAKEADMVPDRASVVRVGGADVALISTREGVFAMDNVCPHSGGSLGDGQVEQGVVTCPLHGWQFECRTGRSLTETRAPQKVYPVKVEGGQVFVQGPAQADAPRPDGGRAPSDPSDPATKKSPAEVWKAEKHGFDVWPDVLRHAADATPMSKIDGSDLERMKWYGFFYRKNNDNDHYMVRVRLPGCEMTAEQARTLATLAYQSGYNILDVTTRGNVQIQGLTIEALPGVRTALERAGLTSRQSGHDNVRNVTSHPWSGFDPEELLDTRDLAKGIQSMLVGDRDLADLPRKVNVALTGRPEAPAHAWTQDISYVATTGPEGDVGFHLLLAGTQGQSPRMAWHVPVFVSPDQVVDVTRAILETFRELGHRHNRQQVRMRYLVERIGADGMLLEVEKRLGTELPRFPKGVARAARDESFVGWKAQKQDGLFALGVCVPVGRLTAEELDGLSVVARTFGDGTLRTTYDQGLVIPGIASRDREEAAYAVARFGLTFEPDPASRSMVACTGKQFCNIAVIETKGYAYRLIEELRRRRVQLHGIRIAMSGCPSNCANGFTADIGLKGLKVRHGLRVLDAFDVFLGGGLGEELQMAALYRKGVPFEELPDALEAVVRDFHLQRNVGETFTTFWQRKLKRHKPEALKVEVPRWQCTRCRHVHVAQDPPPFCPMCAAVRAKFEPAAEEMAAPEAVATEVAAEPPPSPAAMGSRASGRRILIVGGGIAGHVAARTARSLDPAARITLVSQEAGFYNRLNLTRYLAREIEREALFEFGPAWYEEQGVDFVGGATAIALDPVRKAVVLAEGREIEYDALVLAHGSAAALPPFYRDGLPGLHPLRALHDVDAIVGGIGGATRVVIIGGGVLGLEAAAGAQKRGGVVHVLESLPRVMPRQLDTAAAGMLAARLRASGIDVDTGVAVAEILGSERVEGVRLADGRILPADLVVVSTGIRPEVDWLKRSGLRCSRGVIVDERMRTSAPDVFAAGDVCEWRGQVAGLWANAEEQAKVAAANATGKVAFYEGVLPVTALKCFPFAVASIGEIVEDSADVTSTVIEDAEAGTYKKVVFRAGLPVGAILLGATAGLGELRKLVEGGHALRRLRERVLPAVAATA